MFWIPKRYDRFPTIIGRYIVSTDGSVALVQGTTERWFTTEECAGLRALGDPGLGTVIEEWALTRSTKSPVVAFEPGVLKDDYGPEVTLGKHPEHMPWTDRTSPNPKPKPTRWVAKGDGKHAAKFRKGVAGGLKQEDLFYVKGEARISVAPGDAPRVNELTRNGKYRRWCEVIKDGTETIGYVYAEWGREINATGHATRIWQLSIAGSMLHEFTVEVGHPGKDKPENFKTWYDAAYGALKKRENEVDFAEGDAERHESLKDAPDP